MPDNKRVVTLRLFADDVEKLKQYHPRMGYNKVIRALVRQYVARVEDEIERRLNREGAPEDDFRIELTLSGDATPDAGSAV